MTWTRHNSFLIVNYWNVVWSSKNLSFSNLLPPILVLFMFIFSVRLHIESKEILLKKYISKILYLVSRPLNLESLHVSELRIADLDDLIQDLWLLRNTHRSRANDNNYTDFTSEITGGFCNSLWFSCRMAVFISSFSVVWTCNSSRNLAFSSSRYWARNSIWNIKRHLWGSTDNFESNKTIMFLNLTGSE